MGYCKMSIFRCKACSAHLAHINSLQHQVQALEKLVLPSRPTQDVTLDEAERLYEPDSNPILPEDPIALEADRLLTGEFDREEF